VVELQPQRGPADSATLDGPLAAAVVTRPDLAFRLGANATGRRAPSGRAWLGSDAATLAMPGDEKVEPGFEDGLGRGPGMGVGEGVARGVELGEKSPRHGHVKTAKVLGERNGQERRWRNPPKEWFIWLNRDRIVAGRGRRYCDRRRRRQRRNDVPQGRPLDRPQRGGNFRSLTPGEVEEPRKDLGRVLSGDHLPELGDAGDTEPAVPKRLDHLRMSLQEFSGDLPVEGGPLREPELAMEKPEQARVAELGPGSSTVEVGQGDKKLGHGAALPGEELGQAIGEGARSAHAFSIACNPDIARFTPGDLGRRVLLASPWPARETPWTLQPGSRS
jgi:hypothetical protein